ncbi:MAG: hypothetical protein JSU94_06610 [Phycisphaerales bacterium]|nr:MAG: hypothetical protein JSU94_06610 [Phycisphaerales bacterium]
MRTHKNAGAAISFFLTILLLTWGHLEGSPILCSSWHTVQLPGYSGSSGWPGATDTGAPRVTGWEVVWTGRVPNPVWGTVAEIFFFDGSSSRQLSTCQQRLGAFGGYIFDATYIADSNNVVWIEDDGQNYDVFGYDTAKNKGPTQLTFTADAHLKRISDFHDPYVVVECMDQWIGGPWVPTYVDIHLYDVKKNKSVVLNPRTHNLGAQVSNYRVVWQAYNSFGGSMDIFLHDILPGSTVQLTNWPTWLHYSPSLSDPYLAWWGFEPTLNQYKIFFSHLKSILSWSDIATSNALQQQQLMVRVSVPHVIWAWNDDTEGYGIYHYRYSPPFSTTTRIWPMTPHEPGMCEWMDASGSYAAFSWNKGGEMHEIYVYDLVNGGPPQLATMHFGPSPVFVQVSSRQVGGINAPVVVWESYNPGSMVNEGFISMRPVCDPQPKADFNSDCTVDLLDYVFMCSHWGPGSAADLTGDGRTDFADMAILFSEWLNCAIQPPIFRGSGATFP